MLAKQPAILRQGARHRPDRITAGTELRHAPCGAGPGHQALAEGRPQPAVDQRGLAAAGSADDGQKARVGQLVDHGIDLVLPAEEQMLLILSEGPQARKGIRPRAGGGGGAHGAVPVSVTSCRNLAIAASAKPSSPSIRPGSSMSIKSSLSAVLGSARYVDTAGRGLPPR